jgi:pheromone shutdown-related protein TraB
MDLIEVFRQGKALVLMAQLALAAFQRKLGAQLEVQPGAEMLRAVAVAEEVKASLVLADREVRLTLRRVWASLSLWSTYRLLTTIIVGLFEDHTISEEEIERLKSNDVLHAALEEFSEYFPEIRETLINERDRYLAAQIRSAPGKKIVAIIGAGHCPGIKRVLHEPINLEELEQIPPIGLSGLLWRWGGSVFVVGVLLYIIMTAGHEVASSYLWLWALVAMSFSAAGCLLVLAHPLTALVMVVTSPLTMLIPLIKPGLVGALVQTYLRKPRVRDMEAVLDDLVRFRGWYENRVAHVLLIFLVNNLTKWPAFAVLGYLGLTSF